MNRLLPNLRPDFIAPNVEALTPDLFEEGMPFEGVTGVMYDVDGTVASYHAKTVENSVFTTFEAQHKIGLDLFIGHLLKNIASHNRTCLSLHSNKLRGSY